MTLVANENSRGASTNILKRNAEVLAIHLCKSTRGVMEVYVVQNLPYNGNYEGMISMLITVPEMALQTYREIMSAGVSRGTLSFYQIRRIAAGAALGSSFWVAVGATMELTHRECLADELDLLLLPRNWQHPEIWPQLTSDLHLPPGYLEKAKKTARLLGERKPPQQQWHF